MTSEGSALSRPTVFGAHAAALALTAAVMWMLHAAEHSGLIVIGVGVGVYAGVLEGTVMIASQRAERRDRRQRENFDAYLAERDGHIPGHEHGRF